MIGALRGGRIINGVHYRRVRQFKTCQTVGVRFSWDEYERLTVGARMPLVRPQFNNRYQTILKGRLTV